MFERHVCTHIYALQLNSVLDIQKTLTRAPQLGRKETASNRGRRIEILHSILFNPLAPNDIFICRTAQLISRRCILNIYSTNILTEYFKNAAHSPFFSLQDAVYFIMLSFSVPVIFTF